MWMFWVCKASESPTTLICQCLKWFVPKSHEEWSKVNMGCEAKQNCFVRLIQVSRLLREEIKTDAEECKIQCLNKLSCLAYAYSNNIGTESAFSAMNSSMFFLFFLSLLLTQHYCAEVDNITSLQPLAQVQTLVSPSHIFELGFFNTSENKYVGIWHKNILPRKIVWVANREKPLAVADALATSLAINNGNLELVDGKEKSTWSINIPESSNSSAAVLLDNGNFVVADDKGHHLWESFDCPGGTLLPEMALGFDSESGKRNVLTAWKSLNDPSRGLFSVELAQEIPAQGFIWINGSTPYWRSGPWELCKHHFFLFS
ncbi:hypothetical protein DVH24_011631 [Malus domestica]|uniref:Bulb-type lectin domain-containing protein n=1 Tax=Malus domestica TaxID=3750 RepID=A0A498JW46_MALDO|nr:hypothetical protein DVH24_011631 [Malus domestica]